MRWFEPVTGQTVPLVSILVLFVLLVAFSALVHSPSPDETAPLAAGYSHWELGRFELYAVNPPLVRMIASSPMLFFKPIADWRHYSTTIADRSEFRVGRDFVRANGGHTQRYLILGRLCLLPFAILGAIACSFWAPALKPCSLGIAVVVLFAMSPTVLGHTAMITPDVPAASLGCITWFYCRRWVNSDHWIDAVQLGMLLGLCQLTKFTCLVYAALVVVFAMLTICSGKFTRRVKQLTVVSLIALVLCQS